MERTLGGKDPWCGSRVSAVNEEVLIRALAVRDAHLARRRSERWPEVQHRELRDALARDEISVVLQPEVSLRSGEVVRFEALARWRHRTRGPISPAVFIRLAEKSAQITPLTLSVLRQAARNVAEWRQRGIAALIDVNLSMVSLQSTDFPRLVAAFLAEADREASWFGFEITESTFMRDPERTTRAVGALRALGCRISIDDFGSGYSSLARLAALPVNAVKIDRQFVTGMATDHRREAIVRATIALAHDLGFEVVAEGVEDRDTWELLRAHGCDTAQGYHVAKPMAPDAVDRWCGDWAAGLEFIHRAEIGRRLVSTAVTAGGDPRPPVLVIDDEPAILEIISEILAAQGFRVITAVNGAEALRVIGTQSPKVILLDMHMPVVDGRDFVRQLRLTGRCIPIVIMTAGSSAERWARELNADAYLEKPFTLRGLVDVTSRFAAQHRRI